MVFLTLKNDYRHCIDFNSNSIKKTINSVIKASIFMTVYGSPYCYLDLYSGTEIPIMKEKTMQLTHENPITPRAFESMSANSDGYEFPAGKYAWNLGCCQ